VLRSNRVGLRARHEADVPILQSELYDDVAVRSRADSRPWRPIAPGSAASPYAVAEPSEDAACFSVVDLSSDELAGETLLWGIDTHNRTAHVGISLRPAFRNRGLGTDVLRVLCGYGFAVRGLHRLQLETLADNTAMIQAATRVGFTQEGVLRRSAWANGGFADEVILGLLAAEWNAAADHGRAYSSRGRSRAARVRFVLACARSPVAGSERARTGARSSSARSRREASHSAPSCTDRRTHIDGSGAAL